MPTQFIEPVLLLGAISMFVWIIFWMLFYNAKKKKGIKISYRAEVLLFSFYIYIIGVLSLTVIPLPFARFERQPDEDKTHSSINLTPIVHRVEELLELSSRHKTFNAEHALQNIFGNIVLFIPLGIYLPLLSFKFRSMGKVIILAACCSASIELIQLLLTQFNIYRTTDIDDVILNTLGAIIGFVVVNKLYFTKY